MPGGFKDNGVESSGRFTPYFQTFLQKPFFQGYAGIGQGCLWQINCEAHNGTITVEIILAKAVFYTGLFAYKYVV